MKTYAGERSPDGSVRVFIDAGDARRALGGGASPDGLDYGYDGAGPANLARAILADHLGRPPKWWLYRAFQQQFLDGLDRDEAWSISEVEIAAWYIAVKIPHDAEQP